ncbi:MAG: ABC-type Fe3+-hydroxamate transport system substrate-binding protein [Acidimicrobiales bacterium]|jgi:ABC-type Fe3+-hydroxamate transport system substrate-binding protein
MKIVSLVPSLTETSRAWGIEPVACTRYCEQPDLPHVGGTKNPDIDAIVALAPDLVMLDKVENCKEDAEALEERGIELFVTDVRTLADVAPDLDRMAEALQLPSQTQHWPDYSTGPAYSRDSVSPENDGRFFVPIWRRPWMAIGPDTYGSTLLEHLGLANVFTDQAIEYPEIELVEVLALNPNIVLAPSEPYEFQPEHLDELRTVAPVVEVDGQDLFWWGVRTPDAIDRLGKHVAGR